MNRQQNNTEKWEAADCFRHMNAIEKEQTLHKQNNRLSDTIDAIEREWVHSMKNRNQYDEHNTETIEPHTEDRREEPAEAILPNIPPTHSSFPYRHHSVYESGFTAFRTEAKRHDHCTIPEDKPMQEVAVMKPKEEKQSKKGQIRLVAITAAICLSLSSVTTLGIHALLDRREAANQIDLSSSAYTTMPLTHNTTDSAFTSIAEIVDKSADSVVEITTESKEVNAFARQYVTEGAGSGVILTKDGYIVTNDHVIEGATNITVRLNNGTTYPAQLIGSDSVTDLAVLKINASNLTPANFADSDTIRVGDLAVAIGNPLGELGGTVTDGIISALNREITIGNQTMNLLQTSAAINPGNSGGGLFDADGNLVGIVNAKSSGSGIEGLGFAIPANTVADITGQIIDKGYVTNRPHIGIEVVEITDRMTAMIYGVNNLGVYVSDTDGNNKLKAGDLILSVNDTEITSAADINTIIHAHQVNDTLTFTVYRNGSKVNVAVKLTEQGKNTAGTLI